MATDGVDGLEGIAGAVRARYPCARRVVLGLPLAAGLDRGGGHGLSEALGDVVVTGPTLTNVNDFRAIPIA